MMIDKYNIIMYHQDKVGLFVFFLRMVGSYPNCLEMVGYTVMR